MKKDNSNKRKIEQFINYVQQLFYRVKNGEMDPNEISLLDILEKYLSYMILSRPGSINLDIAADFLTSISNLILWKSSLLLPIQQEQSEEEIEEDYKFSSDEYWTEYKKYHSLIRIFEDKEIKQRDIYLTYHDPKIENKEKYQTNDFSDLILAIESILSRKKEHNAINLKKSEHNIMQKIGEIEEKFRQNKGKLSFHKMIADDCSRIEIIVIFLALLELICQDKIYYIQYRNFGDIIFYRKDDKKLSKEKINHRINGKE
ncbi:MAG: segregation and condensation protein A [Atribacterota bacterium]